jgi:hypothetical protein
MQRVGGIEYAAIGITGHAGVTFGLCGGTTAPASTGELLVADLLEITAVATEVFAMGLLWWGCVRTR